MVSVNSNNAVLINNNDWTIQTGKYTFLYISSITQLDLLEQSDLDDYHGLILSEVEPELAHFLIKKIRTTYNNNLYLKPLIAFTNTVANLYLSDKELVDAVIDTHDDIETKAAVVDRINNKISELNLFIDDLKKQCPELYWLCIIYNYLSVRSKLILAASPSSNSSIGYVWPEASVHFAMNKQAEVMGLLDWGTLNGFIRKKLVDVNNACPNCSNINLSMRESCAKCGSSNIEEEDLIHHFPCAYVGPEADFKNEGSDICPKCNKQIGNLGLDYDRPSSIYTCITCNHIGQRSNVSVKCVQCNHESPVELLIRKKIYNYTFRLNCFDQLLLSGNLKEYGLVRQKNDDHALSTIVEGKDEGEKVMIYINDIEALKEKVGNLRLRSLFYEYGQLAQTFFDGYCNGLKIDMNGIIYVYISDATPLTLKSKLHMLNKRISKLTSENLGVNISCNISL